MDDSPPTQRDPWVYELAMHGPIVTLGIIKRLDLFPRKAVPPKQTSAEINAKLGNGGTPIKKHVDNSP